MLRASSVIVLIVYRHRFVNLERDFIIFHDSPLSSSTIYFMLILTSHYSGPCSDYLFAEPYFQMMSHSFCHDILIYTPHFQHCFRFVTFQEKSQLSSLGRKYHVEKTIFFFVQKSRFQVDIFRGIPVFFRGHPTRTWMESLTGFFFFFF